MYLPRVASLFGLSDGRAKSGGVGISGVESCLACVDVIVFDSVVADTGDGFTVESVMMLSSAIVDASTVESLMMLSSAIVDASTVDGYSTEVELDSVPSVVVAMEFVEPDAGSVEVI